MAANNPPGRRNSSTRLLEELEELSHSLYQSHTSGNRRTASLVLPREAVPHIPSPDDIIGVGNDKKNHQQQQHLTLNPPNPRSRRMSLSPWKSRPKLDEDKSAAAVTTASSNKLDDKSGSASAAAAAKKGLWNWKPIRALSHIGMQKLSCLFSIEVVTVQGLPPSMNGLRLSVCVRKKETKDGAVQTMPSRVSHGAADFEETLFVRCHVYCTPGNTSAGTHQKFEPRPFLIYAFAVDAEELDFGRSCVDLSLLIQESIEKNLQGTRVRQWDTSFNLLGKAKGGELVLKLGFQIMEKDGGIGIYSQAEGQKSAKSKNFSPSIGRKQSKSSFSIPSPRMTSRAVAEAWTPSQAHANSEFQGIDELNLDEPAPAPPSTSPSVQKSEDPESKMEDLELPEFEVVDKGVEIQDKEWADEGQSEENSDKRSVSSEVVKEVVQDPAHLTRMTELDAIAQQIKALESMMGEEEEQQKKTDIETDSQRLDADEEHVTKEFFQLLEGEEGKEFAKTNYDNDVPATKLGRDESGEAESEVYLSDLGKGLGCVVQTRNGGYLAAMNPLDTAVARKDTPRLAMQISKPLIIFPSEKSMSGLELFQRMAAAGAEALGSEILCLMPIDELVGKTAEQIAFEGLASAIINGRNKEGASSSAARTIAAVKSMAIAMSTGRKERISSGIWNVNESPLMVEEVVSFSMQKIEAMAVEGLKVQAEMAEEDSPFDVSPLTGKEKSNPMQSAVPLDDWIKDGSANNGLAELETAILSVVVQLRDPLRQYEAVGAPLIAFIYATSDDGEEKMFKVSDLHVGGLKVATLGKKNAWDTEKQKLTAMQWLLAHGLGKPIKKGKRTVSKPRDLLWSISSRIMADMWLKPMRNPDVKFTS